MEKFKTYNALDFSEDPNFIEWVHEGCADNDSPWPILKKNNPSLAKEINEAIDIVNIFKFQEDSPANPNQLDSLFNRIEQSIEHSKEKVTPLKAEVSTQKKSLLRYLVPLAAAAAVALFVFFILPSGKHMHQVVSSTANEKLEYELPDESIIILDGNSSITYDTENYSNNRKVELEGQAFFKIQKGKSFTVHTKNGKVEVLGTTFNVNANNGLTVLCVTGKVKVSNQKSSVINTTGDMSVLENGTIKKGESRNEELKWYKSQKQFKDQPFANIINALEKEYQVEIRSTPEIDKLRYTGFFESGNLEAALRSVTWPLKLKFEINDELVEIKE